MGYIFIFNLEKGKVVNGDSGTDYCIRYYKTDNESLVEIGDGFRHEIFIDEKYWNRLLKIIKNRELDITGIEAIVKGLMHRGIPEEYVDTFITAVKSGIINEI